MALRYSTLLNHDARVLEISVVGDHGGKRVKGLATIPLERLAALFKEVCRDEMGRFAPCGFSGDPNSPKVGLTRQAWENVRRRDLAKAHEMIQAMHGGQQPPSHEALHALSKQLLKLTTKQLHEVKNHYGLKASGKLKVDLRDKLLHKLKDVRTGTKTPAPAVVKEGTYGPSKARVQWDSSNTSSEAAKAQAEAGIKAVFGPKGTAQDAASCAGAPDSAKVYVKHTELVPGNHVISVWYTGTITSKNDKGETETNEYTATRTIKKKGADAKPYVHNDYFRGEGAGLQMFARQVENVTKHGFSHIETHAAGSYVAGPDPNKTYGTFNGYYTWPRFGYDMKLDGDQLARLSTQGKAEVLAGGGKVSALMATDRGRKEWLKKGSSLGHAEFDLTPGSYSQRTLTAYLADKKAKASAKKT